MSKTESFTIRNQILIVFLTMTLALSGVLGAFAYASSRSAQDQLAEAASSSLRLLSAQLEQQMNGVETYLVDTALNSDPFRRLGEETNPLQSYQDGYEIWQSLSLPISGNRSLSGMVMFSLLNNQIFSRSGSLFGNTLEQKAQTWDALESGILRLLQTGPLNTESWFVLTVADRPYYLRAVRYRYAYLTAAIDLGLLRDTAASEYGFTGEFNIESEGKQLLPVLLAPSPDQIRTHAGYSSFRAGAGSYLVVEDHVGALTFQYAHPSGSGRLSGNRFGILFLLCAAVSAASTVAMWLYLKRAFFEPLNGLVSTMEQIGRGDLTAPPSTRYKSLEFKQVNDTFNTMIDQITALKIESYERQLEAQRREMISLKLQIRPHFYLNCLKNIYGFAEIGETDHIQQLILLLSAHLRYVFSYQTETVPLQQELDMCRNYLELCSVGQREAAQWHVEMDESLRDLAIPTISILSFVENCAKYAARIDRPLVVSVTASYLELENQAMADLSITDNGPGFSDEQMSWLNELDGTQLPDTHVGIVNVLRRFRLLYGESFAAAFTNARSGGAQIELFLPLDSVPK